MAAASDSGIATSTAATPVRDASVPIWQTVAVCGRGGVPVFRRGLALLVGATLVVSVAAVGVHSARAQQPATAPRPAAPYDSILTTSIRDIQDFWSEQMPAVYGVRYQALPKSHINAYTSKTD